jgi:uncharacterized OB-fold protein
MAKQGVVPDALTQPFWDAANEGRLVIQHCHACNRLQHPPAPTCQQCGSGDHLGWQEMSGRGTIYNYGVVYDCPVRLLQQDQPFNVAVIMLDEDPGIQRENRGQTGIFLANMVSFIGKSLASNNSDHRHEVCDVQATPLLPAGSPTACHPTRA